MDRDIETWVTTCNKCQKSRPTSPLAPVLDWETPRGPWSRIHIDFAGPTKGYTFLIIVDAYSNWLEVSVMNSTTTEAVTKQLRKLFATHGLPDLLVSDNGPQFTALAFEQFLAEQGIRHALTAPAHPASNGRAERMVRYTKEALEKIDTGDIQDKINTMLTIQHIMPSTSTNKSPAELLRGRKLRTYLDRLHPTYNPEKPPDSSRKYRTFIPGDLVYAKKSYRRPIVATGYNNANNRAPVIPVGNDGRQNLEEAHRPTTVSNHRTDHRHAPKHRTCTHTKSNK
ncbi:uncharacterized protein K02A2.6-like [Notechis scutatus]|uniref:Uncharacterized protein K02A2.6-like n=1 Tax=Notechis scutatus TaxID=8663 RepID=A0A6J1V8S8_9SAUR|nr:uncharacterized protein K02A2.6-like [Notechis scutatus]